ncbi:MAG: phosphate ABC transporter, permease protein PstA [Zetaproteobacteria bacterium CG12_big_fil_rev_8_21_14_0_65_54_13]|nr:MAG: phosphate ABC transporter, permease protein PstA [Zetaproteobacteria bacterium CG23_combo_of_CG06-09_8_20_14_all_54_7]PIW44140.1 MAG: phosphate ABC transporter, permease protein PstA [Zetaproteobacteria bacterium CG12_big_fil_rev_8_21_14_0_65_54_13]PIX55409.1 MAG: phosphate ABC transporter, permease protein PstA [Zetaproteobacteria bacterium CG_4_10_14_3_um_filter_54_28]PJA29097.1 MAG: phosphate ABC transporter, permease protein PstA [Zetaproteobacteria bacterium CG_4_9_14_3_um_filter_54
MNKPINYIAGAANPRQKQRERADTRFRLYGMTALALAMMFLVFFFIDIIGKAIPAFYQTEVHVTINYVEAAKTNYNKAIDHKLSHIVSRGWLRGLPQYLQAHPEMIGSSSEEWVAADSRVDQYIKQHDGHGLKSRYQKIVDEMSADGRVRQVFNSGFFTTGDSKLPEQAGIMAAAVGSVFTLLLTMLVAVPIGVMTAIYLEEFADDNTVTRAIEVNINNLAAIPSILYGLLGLAIFINFMGVPRSSALAGGLTLALMTLPIIIIATRASLRAVPETIREAAYGLGASSLQTVWHHVLPLAMPGILTGSIIGLAQAMGETAPLIIVGMMAYIPEPSSSILDATTVLPAQVYTWSTESMGGYAERTSAGILVLLTVLLSLNAVAVKLRNRSQQTW